MSVLTKQSRRYHNRYRLKFCNSEYIVWIWVDNIVYFIFIHCFATRLGDEAI